MLYQELRAALLSTKSVDRQPGQRKRRARIAFKNHFLSLLTGRNREATTKDFVSDIQSATVTQISHSTAAGRLNEREMYMRQPTVSIALNFRVQKGLFKLLPSSCSVEPRRLRSNGIFHGQGRQVEYYVPLSRSKHVKNQCSDYIWSRQYNTCIRYDLHTRIQYLTTSYVTTTYWYSFCHYITFTTILYTDYEYH